MSDDRARDRLPVLPDRRRRDPVDDGPCRRPRRGHPGHRTAGPTHVLFLPRAHIRSAAQLTEADGPLLGRLFAAAAAFARARASSRTATGS